MKYPEKIKNALFGVAMSIFESDRDYAPAVRIFKLLEGESMPSKLDIKASRATWDSAITNAERHGDRTMLAWMLRDAHDQKPIPWEVRIKIADFIEGKTKWKKVSITPAKSQADLVRIIFEACLDSGYNKKKAFNTTGEVFSIHSETVRDVVEYRHTFSMKKSVSGKKKAKRK